MQHAYIRISLAAMLLASAATFAAERTAALAVENLTCPSCPYILKQSLKRLPGVKHVEVSFEQKTALVTFDDAKTDVVALTKAAHDAGFPSRPIEG